MAVIFFQFSHWRLKLGQSLELVTVGIVINVVIGGFGLAHVMVRLQVSDYSQLSDYTVQLQLCRLSREKYSTLCTNHIQGNCNCFHYLAYSWRAGNGIDQSGFSRPEKF